MGKLKLSWMILLSAIWFTACQSQDQAEAADQLESFMALMAHNFATPETDTDNIILDRRFRVNSRELSGVWLYTQLNTGADQKLYRQRLNEFTLRDDGSIIVQKSYALKDPGRLANLWDNPELATRITLDDLEAFMQEGCEMVWRKQEDHRWAGQVDPQTCRIFSTRRNQTIHIGSDSEISEGVYKTSERGFDVDGNHLWGTKPGELITLYRVEHD